MRNYAKLVAAGALSLAGAGCFSARSLWMGVRDQPTGALHTLAEAAGGRGRGFQRLYPARGRAVHLDAAHTQRRAGAVQALVGRVEIDVVQALHGDGQVGQQR